MSTGDSRVEVHMGTHTPQFFCKSKTAQKKKSNDQKQFDHFNSICLFSTDL